MRSRIIWRHSIQMAPEFRRQACNKSGSLVQSEATLLSVWPPQALRLPLHRGEAAPRQLAARALRSFLRSFIHSFILFLHFLWNRKEKSTYVVPSAWKTRTGQTSRSPTFSSIRCTLASRSPTVTALGALGTCLPSGNHNLAVVAWDTPWDQPSKPHLWQPVQENGLPNHIHRRHKCRRGAPRVWPPRRTTGSAGLLSCCKSTCRA